MGLSPHPFYLRVEFEDGSQDEIEGVLEYSFGNLYLFARPETAPATSWPLHKIVQVLRRSNADVEWAVVRIPPDKMRRAKQEAARRVIP